MAIQKLSAALLVLGILSAGAVQAQTAAPPNASASRPAGGPPPSPPGGQKLTDAQLAKVKSVLAPYKSASLTPEDAKTIKRTLRDAGMGKSRELDSALNAAGFSPEKLDLLDPPPPRPAGEGAPPPAQKK
jgi:hypothetical protein